MNRLQSGSNPVIIKPEIVKDITNFLLPFYYLLILKLFVVNYICLSAIFKDLKRYKPGFLAKYVNKNTISWRD